MARPTRILLVEDNPADVFFVRAGLEQSALDVEILHIDDGSQARALAEKIGGPDSPCPHIVLLDLNLPGASGLHVLAALRANPLCSSVPVIIVTSSDADVDRQRVAQYNISFYFLKPADLDAFLKVGEVVRRVLHAHSTGSSVD